MPYPTRGDQTCLTTQIRNSSNKKLSRVSMFLGRTLEVDEAFTVKGDVFAWLAGKFPGIKGHRMIEKFVDLVDDGTLKIDRLPTAPCGDIFNQSSSSATDFDAAP